MVIIKAVWQELRDAGETDNREASPNGEGRTDFTMNTQYSPKLPVKQVVCNAVLDLTGGDTTIIFTNKDVKALISS